MRSYHEIIFNMTFVSCECNKYFVSYNTDQSSDHFVNLVFSHEALPSSSHHTGQKIVSIAVFIFSIILIAMIMKYHPNNLYVATEL